MSELFSKDAFHHAFICDLQTPMSSESCRIPGRRGQRRQNSLNETVT